MSVKSGAPPHLLHFRVSHFNEKVRWALDYKRWPHYRTALVPGFHVPRVLVEIQDGVADRPGFRWVLDTYVRHRGTSFEIDSACHRRRSG